MSEEPKDLENLGKEAKSEKISEDSNLAEDLIKLKEDLIERKEKNKNLKNWEEKKRIFERNIDLNSLKDKIKQFLIYLINIGSYKGQLATIRMQNEKMAKYKKPEKLLPETIQKYLDREKIWLYSHQAKTIDLIRKRKNVIITTSTASGKSLAYNIPIIERLMTNENSRALYLYPTKALTKDQLKNIQKMLINLELDFNPNIYQKGTPREVKPYIRNKSRIIMGNPYGFHEYIQQHNLWKDFFSNLEFIVIDEAHFYNGAFGSNVAYLIRRILRICRTYGSEPQFILSSATIPKPLKFAKKLTGQDFEVVKEDGSGQGKRYFILWNPPLKDHLKNTRYSSFGETIKVLTKSLKYGIQTLCFTQTHQSAERISMNVRKKMKYIDPSLVKKIKTYRGGYLDEKRTKIENQFKRGELLGVVSTPALELGIDIGSLECVIMSGYPGKIISAWQQAGRAGRNLDEAIIIMIANQHPLDQYYMKHPAEFFKMEKEVAVIDLENPYIIEGQILCAIAESNKELLFTDETIDSFPFPIKVRKAVQNLEEKGLIRQRDNIWELSEHNKPRNSDLHSISYFGDTVNVIFNNKLIEEVSLFKAYDTLYPGAIYYHSDETYISTEFNAERGYVRVKKIDANYYTEAMDSSQIQIIQSFEEKLIGKGLKIGFGYGEIKVRKGFSFYLKKVNNEVIEKIALNQNPYEFNTMSMWIVIPQIILERIKQLNLDFSDEWLGILCAMTSLAPLLSLCENWDIGGISFEYHPELKNPAIFIYDSHEKGNGVSKRLFKRGEALIRTTLEHIMNCECEYGCPSCILVHRCGRKKVDLNKKITIQILQFMVDIFDEEYSAIYEEVGKGEVLTQNQVNRSNYKLLKKNQVISKVSNLNGAQERIEENTLNWYNKGRDLSDSNEKKKYFKKGLQEVKEIYKLYSWIGIGDCYNEKYDFQKAQNAYNKALELAEGHNQAKAIVLKLLGDMEMRIRNFDKAETYFTKAINSYNDYAPAWNAIGIISEKLDNFDKALLFYKKAMEKGSNEAIENYKNVEKMAYISFKRNLENTIEKERRVIKELGIMEDIKKPFRAYQGNDPYIFISYAHENAKIVFEELKIIRNLGYNIYYDEGIPLSKEWAENLEEKIKKCKLFLVFLTPTAVNRPMVRHEIYLALNYSKNLLHIHLEPTKLKYGLELLIGPKVNIEKSDNFYLDKLSEYLKKNFQN